jgi:hypothetical protein
LGASVNEPDRNNRREQALQEQALQEQALQELALKVAIGGPKSSFIFRTPFFGEVFRGRERIVDPA